MKTTSSNTNIWKGHQAGLSELCGYDVELYLQIMQSNILQKMWTELPFYLGMCTTTNDTQIKLLSNVLRYWTLICTRQTIQHNKELIKNSVHGQQSSSLLIPWNFYILIMRLKKNIICELTCHCHHNTYLQIYFPVFVSIYIVNHVVSGLPRHTDINEYHGYHHTSQTPKRIPRVSCQQTYRLGFAGLF